jgi:sarcosine oxidase
MISTTSQFETIVIGLGAMGSAAVYQLSKKGNNVLGLDQFTPPHIFGSTHGDTRITRQAIGEGEQYVPLALRSYEIWQEIEQKTGKDLLTTNGGLIMGDADKTMHGKDRFLHNTIEVAKKYNIPHSILSASELRERFPQFTIKDNYIGYYENNAGFLRPELCVKAQLSLAKEQGAEIHMNEKVIDIVPQNDQTVSIYTDKATYTANKVIVSAGPWITRFFPEFKNIFKVYRQVLYWFAVEDEITLYQPERMPIFIFAGTDDADIYGFPAIDGPNDGIKIAFEQYETTTAPETVNRGVTQDEIERAYTHYFSKHLPGLSSKCLRSASCLYTVTPDSQFVIDKHPQYPQIIIASPCSGHGFKHSAAIGEALAELAIGSTSHLDLDTFALSRFR